MQSAPAHIPATRVASFGEELAESDLIRGSAIRILGRAAVASGHLVNIHLHAGWDPGHPARLPLAAWPDDSRKTSLITMDLLSERCHRHTTSQVPR
jgi:hypothetical protein